MFPRSTWHKRSAGGRSLAAAVCLLAASVIVSAPVVCAAQTGTTTAPNVNSSLDPTTNAEQLIYSLSGSVVNSVTGEPVIRALVTLTGRSRSVFTDRDGRFRFNKLPVMPSTMLMVARPGFYAYDQQARQQMSMTRVTVGPDQPDVVVKLTPDSGISGQITDENGEPLEDVRVSVLASVIQQGRKRIQRMNGAQTDGDGQFHINSLSPGEYILSAGPVTASGDSTAGHAQIFYPNVMESSQASKIDVQPGQNARADIVLPPAKTFRISGRIVGSNMGFPQIVNESGDQAGNPEQFDPNVGTFVAHVTCTTCIVKARNFGRDSEYGEATLNLDGDLDNVTVQMSVISVPVNVEYVGTKPETVTTSSSGDTPAPMSTQASRTLARRNPSLNPVNLRLTSLSRLHPDVFSNVTGCPDNCEWRFMNLEFGKYNVEVQSITSGWYIYSIRYGSQNLDEEPIQIQGGPSQPIDIVLKDDVASMSGTVDGNTDANAAATVLVIPRQLSARIRTFPVTGNGTFQASNMAPGQYKIYAFDSINNLEYANSEVMKQYSAQGVDLTLAANGSGQVTVPLTKRAQ